MKKVINSLAVVRRDYKVKNFKQFTSEISNVFVRDNGICNGYGYAKTGVKSSNADKVFLLNDRFYFTSGGAFYLLDETGEKEICKVDENLCFAQIILDGQRVNFFIDNQSSFVLQGEEITPKFWVPADVTIMHNGRLFSAKGRVITFSKQFDFETQSVNLNVDGSLRVDVSSGNVIGFMSDNDTLFVFCENAIYTIFTGAETIDFVFKKACALERKIEEKSLVVSGNVAYFLSGKKICKYNKSSIKTYGELLNTRDFSDVGYASFCDNAYLLPLKLSGRDDFCLYVYDCDNGAEGFFETELNLTCCGYYFLDGEIVKFIKGGNNEKERKFVSGIVYPSDSLETDLCEINFFAGGTGSLNVVTAYGKESFSIQNGYNSIKKIICSPWFVFEFYSQNNEFLIKDFLLKYIDKGEIA